ncbi:hypothetical protein [Candidatus Mesenet endosymbiont of Agriotes lineatus]|uniref:hypothetical protein n=1 Tax=Candidatus Mesenet endosymbiont of Agriotes lineatus TaxID=3077948 RepID=UPI0030D577A3
MLGCDIGFYSRDYLISYFKDKYSTSILHSAIAMGHSDSNTDINKQVKVSTNFIYINNREEKNLHIEITNIDLTKGRSLKRFASLFNSVFTQTSCRKNDVFLLRLCSTKGQKNPYDSLIRFYSIKGKIDRYCRRNHILQSDVKLTLINLCAFNRLKFDANKLEQYIQFKNEELSRCTEEELNEQAEKFINPHNYSDHFKNEVFVYSRAATTQEIEKGIYTIVNSFILINHNTSLQRSQISASTAIFTCAQFKRLSH